MWFHDFDSRKHALCSQVVAVTGLDVRGMFVQEALINPRQDEIGNEWKFMDWPWKYKKLTLETYKECDGN